MFSLAAKAVCGYPSNLSAGDIIVILYVIEYRVWVVQILFFFFRAAVLLFVWLLVIVGGIIIKRYVLGAKGWEQVPCIDWYKAFGNLQAVSFFASVPLPIDI